MKQILIQAGHENTVTSSTGAPEEGKNNIRIRNRLGEVLISKGFQVFLCDATFRDVNHDYDLAISLHCDANYAGDEGGGFIDFPDPSIDYASVESKRIKEAIESEYFDHSGIKNMPNRSNPNTKFYYWWSYLSARTPCTLLEMGESVDPHDRVILSDTDRVANAIARGICKAFDVPFNLPIPIPPMPPEPPQLPPEPDPVPVPDPPVSNPSQCEHKLSQVNNVVWDKWKWVGKQGWRERRRQLKLILS